MLSTHNSLYFEPDLVAAFHAAGVLPFPPLNIPHPSLVIPMNVVVPAAWVVSPLMVPIMVSTATETEPLQHAIPLKVKVVLDNDDTDVDDS